MAIAELFWNGLLSLATNAAGAAVRAIAGNDEEVQIEDVATRRPFVNPGYAPTDAEVAALEGRYVRWAEAHGLAESLPTHRKYFGRMRGRDLTFATGLGGVSPAAPQLVVQVTSRAKRTILLTGRERLKNDVERTLAELLDSFPRLRNVGVTKRYVRLTFEAGTETGVFDDAMQALEERLRALEPSIGAYRGRAP